MEKFDFGGWATKVDLKCSDGRVIKKDAFAHNDGETVPLVWNHQHNEADNILGHALLENRDEGVYAHCAFNDTPNGRTAKELVKHGDIESLSIFANKLKQDGCNVIHGAIKEVSLVIAGANPGAFIDSIMYHGEELDDECVISPCEPLDLAHSEEEEKKEMNKEDPKAKTAEDSDETVEDVFNTLSEKQKTAVYALMSQIMDDSGETEMNDEEDDNEDPIQHSDINDEGDIIMKHNVFENENEETEVLSQSDIAAIFKDAQHGSLREATLAHGIDSIDYLFPDAQTMNSAPAFVARQQDWVKVFMNAVHHTPFSRVKSVFANITEEDARAKGYMKGNLKTEEVFTLLKRTTLPTTIYKKQKLERDDVIDIVDFDVVAWLKTEMRMMLDEEIARAALLSDGRSSASNDKINETNIRPIWKDDDFYTIKQVVTVASNATDDQKAKAIIRAAVKARKNYKGSGNPVYFTTEDVLTDMLLIEDTTGRVIYETVEKLAIAMRVSKIVTVPVMDGCTREVNGTTRTLAGIIVNPQDYNVGADKGGAVNMFDDFDIDYNAQKYLIETRCSGALVVPYSAIALEVVVGA